MSVESKILELNISDREVILQMQECGDIELSFSFLLESDRREFTYGSLCGGSDDFRSKIHDQIELLYPDKKCFVKVVGNVKGGSC